MQLFKRVNGKLSPEDAEACVQAAVASQRLEGLDTPAEESEMLRVYACGSILEDEYMSWVWERAGVK